MDTYRASFLSSAGASRKDLSSGYAEFLLNDDIYIVSGKTQVACIQFNFLNEFVNISAAIGNNVIYYSDDDEDLDKYSITIPDGAYSLSDLNDFLQRELSAAALGGLFTLIGNYANGKVGIQFGDTTGYYVYFAADSPYTLLGFTSTQSIPDVGVTLLGNTADYVEYAGTRATFDSVTAVKLGTNLTGMSISNTSRSNVILQCPIVVEPLLTQSYEPTHLSWVPIIAGGTTRNIVLYVYDQSNDALELQEDFSATLLFRTVQ